jgi:anti-anti-sigma factor
MLDSPVLQVDVRPGAPHQATLALSGELDLSTCPTLRACVEQLDPAFRQVTLDLTGLAFIDSTGIALLLGLERSFNAGLRQLVVRCPPGHVRRVLAMSGADSRLTLVE